MANAAASTSLALRHVFGVNVTVLDNLSFTDEETLAYVAGHNIVLHNIKDNRQRFIQSSEIVDCVTTYCSGSGKRLAALAERGDRPSLHIFDLRTCRRKKTFQVPDLLAKEIISMQFSEDNQLLVSLSNGPDWSLTCWNWARAKMIATIGVSTAGGSLTKCMFSPIDSSLVVVIGRECVKFYRLGERDIRVLNEHSLPGCNCTVMSWMRNPEDHLLVGTDDGKVILFRSGELVAVLECSPGPSLGGITSLTCIPSGFVVGTSGSQLVLYGYDESKDQVLFDTQFKHISTISLVDSSMNGGIMTLAICPKDERLVCLTTTAQILGIPILPGGGMAMSSITSDSVTQTICPFHGPKAVCAMDVAVRKPLIATASKDGTLRIWNFQKHTLELQKNFPEEMFSVALHPTGLHCAVGFTDKLRVFHILVDDLRICMEVAIKSCRECRFTHGGGYLAATNGNAIVVFDVYTGDKVADLRGHNSKVRAIHWQPSDAHLLSCGMDGAVYLWSVEGSKRAGEFVQKGTLYTSVVHTSNSVLVVGSDRSLRELSLPDLAPSKLHDAGLILSNIESVSSKNVLIASTSESNKPANLRVYPFPLTGDYDDYPCTGGAAIQRVRLTADENFLVVTDEAGCVYVYELHGRQDRFQRNNAPSAYSELITLPDWSEEALVTRAELEDCNTAVAELKTKLEELKLNNEYKLKLKDMNYAEQIKETTDDFVQQLEVARTKYELLAEKRGDVEKDARVRLSNMEEIHQSNLQNRETQFQAQIMDLMTRHQKLTSERDAQIAQLDKKRRVLVATHEHYVEELKRDYERKLDQDRQSRIKAAEEQKIASAELTEEQKQVEDDIETEINNLRQRYEEQLAASRETTLKYKGENGIMNKKSVLLARESENQVEEMRMLEVRDKELHEQIKSLESEVSSHKRDIKTRDLTIGEKEKRIYELKKKNQELDKFKFVLDFKIRELKQQIEPRQMEIMAMREKIKQTDSELEQFHKNNAALDTLIGELRSKIEEMQDESKAKRMNAKRLENVVNQCRSDVQTVMQFIQTPSELLNAVQKIVVQYGSMESVKPRIDPEVEAEYNRHREFLQASIADLKKVVDTASHHHMIVNHEMREKNMRLINDINAQREENRILKNAVQAEIGRIRHFLQATNKRANKLGSLNMGSQTSADSQILAAARSLDFDEEESLEPLEMIDKNRRRIVCLERVLRELESRIQRIEDSSQGLLPPIDGGSSSSVPKSTASTVPQLPPLPGMQPATDADEAARRKLVIDELTPRHAGQTYATEYRESPRP